MRHRRQPILTLVAAALVGVLATAPRWALAAPAKEPAVKPKPPALEIDDPTEKFVPKRKRTEAEEDRLQALALFAAGRMAEQKQDMPKALRFYQRALRFDPDSVAVLREIVPLAFSINHQQEAVRYALMIVEKEPTDPVLLRRLAIYLTEEQDYEQALKLYERAKGPKPPEKPAAEDVVLWMEIGRLAYLTKKYEQSADNFTLVLKALEKPGDYGLNSAQVKAILGKAELTHQLFGEAFLEANRPAEAAAAFEKSNEARPNAGLLAYNLARVEAKKKQPAAALEKLQACFATHQADQGTAPYQLLADVLADLGKKDELVGRLEKLYEADKDNMPLSYFLAQQYRQAEQYDKAEPIYLQLIEKHQKRPPVEAYQGLVAIYRKGKRPDALVKIVADAVGKAGNLAPLGDEGKELAADKDLVKSLVERIEKLQADGAKLDRGQRLAGGLLALEVKQFDVARQFFEPAIAEEPGKAAEVLLNWGLELFLANQYADAARVFQRGVDDAVLPAGNPAFFFYLAGALEMDGKTDAAIEAAQKAAEKQRDNPRFQSRPAWILYHAKRYKDAEKAYKALLEKFDSVRDSTEVRDVLREARLVLSNICVLDNRMPESEEWLEQVLDEFPEDAGALNDLGYLWADQEKHLERSLRMVQAAVAQEPKNMAYRDSLGWAYYRLGRYAEAVTELKTAAAVDDPDGVILDHLGDAQYKAGDKKAAIANWQRAVELLEKAKEIDKAKVVAEKIVKAK